MQNFFRFHIKQESRRQRKSTYDDRAHPQIKHHRLHIVPLLTRSSKYNKITITKKRKKVKIFPASALSSRSVQKHRKRSVFKGFRRV